MTQGFGQPGIDRSVEGKPLSIGGKKFEHGVGSHAPSEMHFDLKGGSSRFSARVGIDEEDGAIRSDGSVEFFVEGDGKVLWQSGVMKGGMAAKEVTVDLKGVNKLTLRASDAGDGTGRDHADWAEAVFQVTGAKPEPETAPPLPSRWSLGEGISTVWQVAADTRLPHDDFIEQGGLRVGQIVNYAVDTKRALTMKRNVIWPCLRIRPNNTHGSLIHRYEKEAEPVITIDGEPLGAITVERVLMDGTVTVEGKSAQGLAITRCNFPSMSSRTAIERWTIKNSGKAARKIEVAALALHDEKEGPYGVNVMEVSCTAPASLYLAPGKELSFAVLFSGGLEKEPAEKIDPVKEEKARRSYVAALQKDLRLETPEPELDRAFAMAKIRVAESINATRGGLMLAPGGLNYYAATWCNDNVEYAGPFFPFLGDANGNQASLDSYRGYAGYMKPDYKAIPSSIVAEGTDTWHGAGDRGDAAMYAYGCARFCLANGDKKIAEEFWPAIQWCLEYCKRQTTADGVIASDADELEGRFPAGKANLSTASLCYGGLRSAADLARVLGKTAEAGEYDQRAGVLAKAIEKFFGAKVEGFDTYRYYDGNDILRSWICLPLCMGLMERRDATLAALFSPRLWTADGLATQAGNKIFWDRSTLYGLSGAFHAGATEEALPYLTAYSRRRLLGEHVPYPVETGVQGSQLSSESGLYCRIFTEGMFGILPTGLDRFRCTPRLPAGWPRMALRSIRAFNRTFDVVVERRGEKQHLTVLQDGKAVAEQDLADGESAEVKLR